jgi:hypothetical protein
MADYDIDIEIDADTDEVVWTKNGRTYYYTVEELEGKGLLDKLMDKDGIQITVYSQNERYTVDEYKALSGDTI